MLGGQFGGQGKSFIAAAADDGRRGGVVLGEVAGDGDVLAVEGARGDEGSHGLARQRVGGSGLGSVGLFAVTAAEPELEDGIAGINLGGALAVLHCVVPVTQGEVDAAKIVERRGIVAGGLRREQAQRIIGAPGIEQFAGIGGGRAAACTAACSSSRLQQQTARAAGGGHREKHGSGRTCGLIIPEVITKDSR